jgi:hypothetical protein
MTSFMPDLKVRYVAGSNQRKRAWCRNSTAPSTHFRCQPTHSDGSQGYAGVWPEHSGLSERHWGVGLEHSGLFAEHSRVWRTHSGVEVGYCEAWLGCSGMSERRSRVRLNYSTVSGRTSGVGLEHSTVLGRHSGVWLAHCEGLSEELCKCFILWSVKGSVAGMMTTGDYPRSDVWPRFLVSTVLRPTHEGRSAAMRLVRHQARQSPRKLQTGVGRELAGRAGPSERRHTGICAFCERVNGWCWPGLPLERRQNSVSVHKLRFRKRKRLATRLQWGNI